MFFPIEEWFPAFLLTMLVEISVVLIGFRDAGVSPTRLAVMLVFANLATHQAVWFVYTQLFLVGTVEYLAAAECWAAAAEAVFWWTVLPGVTVRRAITVAITANALSFVIGRVLQELWPDLLRLPT